MPELSVYYKRGRHNIHGQCALSQCDLARRVRLYSVAGESTRGDSQAAQSILGSRGQFRGAFHSLAGEKYLTICRGRAMHVARADPL